MGIKPLDSFSSSLHEQAQHNLTLEQLCNKFALQIGISPEVLSLPGAIDFIVDRITAGNKGILETDFDDAMKQFKSDWIVAKQLSEDCFINRETGDIIKIFGYNSDNIVIMINQVIGPGISDMDLIDTRVYDKKTKVEIVRQKDMPDIKMKYGYRRYPGDLGKVVMYNRTRF